MSDPRYKSGSILDMTEKEEAASMLSRALAVLMDAAERWLDYSSCVCKSCGPQHCLPCLVRAALARLKLKDERV